MAFYYWLPAIGYAALLFFLSSQSRPPGAGSVPDYVAHFTAYAFFAATVVWGITRGFGRPFTQARAFGSWMIVTLYGVSDELHQWFVPNRHASLQDVIVNSLGALVVVILFYRFQHLICRQ